ncbi:S-layer homology domain-containing protein [Paenibacillus contaminans]|uniref:SLH domain-containing protein n=1 Tax=Paenibacillus contaminans TaxID=450362 RepID=A0A329MSK4_9BACL|nr:S-layer homology domain-containing protein [Paenibacillus contaminans]RAV22951.1 hypothetical protein DQG23_01740 [Paenibacillus contaminans]
MLRRIVWLAILLMGTAHLLYAPAYAEAAPIYELIAGKIANGQVTLTVSGKNLVEFYGYEAEFSYDPESLELLEFNSGREGFAIAPIVKNNKVIIAHTKIGDVAGDRGNIAIGTLTFKLKKYGESTVKWESIKVVTGQAQSTTTAVGKRVAISKAFADLDGHWAKADIEWLAMKGIIEGVDDTHFKPDAEVTRAQFVAMMARALKLQVSTTVDPFDDVPQDAWYADAVRNAYAAGMINGITYERFAPERDITREEMTVMLMRAGRHVAADVFKDVSIELTFTDASEISKWAVGDVTLALHAGLMQGGLYNKFMPQSQATRAEAAVVIKRLLSHL